MNVFSFHKSGIMDYGTCNDLIKCEGNISFEKPDSFYVEGKKVIINSQHIDAITTIVDGKQVTVPGKEVWKKYEIVKLNYNELVMKRISCTIEGLSLCTDRSITSLKLY